jgi:hypothetical protein
MVASVVVVGHKGLDLGFRPAPRRQQSVQASYCGGRTGFAGEGATPVERSFRSDLLDDRERCTRHALSVFEVVFKLPTIARHCAYFVFLLSASVIDSALISPDAAHERGRRHERDGRGLSSRSRECTRQPTPQYAYLGSLPLLRVDQSFPHLEVS